MTAGLASYVATIARIYREQGSANDNVDYTIAGLNTDVTPMKHKKWTTASKGRDLTLAERRQFRDSELEDIHDVISMFCLDLGCQHRRLMYYFANGRMTDVPPVVRFCGSACPICTGKWHGQFLPVRKEAVYQWLDFVRDTLPVKATVDNLFGLLWKQTEWVNAIFDKGESTVKKYNVEAFLLQLIAAKFITARKASLVPHQSRFGTDLIWILVKNGTKLHYKLDNRWLGINLHPSRPNWQYPIP